MRPVRDVHIWPMSTTETALTAQLVVPAGHPGDGFLRALAHDLEHECGIGSTRRCRSKPARLVTRNAGRSAGGYLAVIETSCCGLDTRTV